jgi:hypothetical protein
VLQDLLNEGVVDHDVAAAVGAAINVRALPPDRLQSVVTDATPTLNVFLYNVTPNTGWRNHELPVRNPRGDVVRPPLLALDLHYLVTAFGFDDLQAEILLGFAMRTLHENPILTRAQITRALSPAPPVSGGLPATLEALDRSGLADQIEQVKIIENYLSTEEMTRIWTAMQTQYRPTTAYLVSVVLIESELPSRIPRPVLRIGPDSRGATVFPFLLPPVPTITRLIPPARQPSVRLGDTFVVEGRNLIGSSVEARIAHARLADPLTLAPDAGNTATLASFTIPDTPASRVAWAAGPALLTLRVQRPGEPEPRESNAWPVMIAPTPDLAGATVTHAAGAVGVDLTVRPELREGQEILLTVGDQTAPADPLGAGQSATAHFDFADMAVGGYLAWLRLDGVDSWFTLRDLPPVGPDFQPRPPEFDPAATVTVPA